MYFISETLYGIGARSGEQQMNKFQERKTYYIYTRLQAFAPVQLPLFWNMAPRHSDWCCIPEERIAYYA
jgi:hypothetical protein